MYHSDKLALIYWDKWRQNQLDLSDEKLVYSIGIR